MRKTLMSVAAGAATLTLVACGTDASSNSATHNRAATGGDESPSSSATQEPAAQTVRVVGAHIIPYAAKSLREFVADPWIVGAVRGTVIKVESKASDVGNVTSIVTVSVKRGLDLKAGSTIEVSEPGGIVPMSEVRSDFEGKDWQDPLTTEELSQMIDYQHEGFPHSNVGDEVVMFLAAGADGVYTLATKLVPRGAGFTFKDGDPPNPRWGLDVPAATVDSLVQDSTK